MSVFKNKILGVGLRVSIFSFDKRSFAILFEKQYKSTHLYITKGQNILFLLDYSKKTKDGIKYYENGHNFLSLVFIF